MFLVELLLQFLGRLEERVGGISKDTLAGLLVEEIFVDSSFVERRLLVGQGMLEVLSVGEVNLDSIFVVLVVLVFQSLLEVALDRQINLGLAAVDDTLGCLVIRTVFVIERFLQVRRLFKELQDGELMELVFLVSEGSMVNLGIFEFLSGELLCLAHSLLVRGQKSGDLAL